MPHYEYNVQDTKHTEAHRDLDPGEITVGKSPWVEVQATMTMASREGWELVTVDLSRSIRRLADDEEVVVCQALALWRREVDD